MNRKMLFIAALSGLFMGQLGYDTAMTSGSTSARELLQRALTVTGVTGAGGKVLHYFAAESHLQTMQSDRMYPPYYAMSRSLECWLDSQSGVERISGTFTYFGFGPDKPSVSLVGLHSAFMLRDTLSIPVGLRPDKLNVWTVLREWGEEMDLRMGRPTVYRDYLRDVIVRSTPDGEQRLFLDRKTGFPVKLDVVEPHFLWGQVHVEYVYSTWIQVGEAFVPSGSFRTVDGETDIYRTIGKAELLTAEQAPDLAMPDLKGPRPPEPTMNSLRSPEPDTVKLGTGLFLLRNRFYTEGAAMIDGTVYVFDATIGEQRAKQDEARIEKLFPGNHPVVVVVSDLAWPHIAGLRYWVSKGAAIVAHRMNESFLRRVIERKWTLNPDELEKKRRAVRFKFVPVDSAASLAGGKVKVYAIDGIGSEGTLMSYLPDEKFLWAGDCIQDVSRPTAYATEVWNAVRRVGIKPERTAAQHLPVTAWSRVDSLSRQNGMTAAHKHEVRSIP